MEFGDVFNFNGMFGAIEAGQCRIDYKGRTAVKTSKGYRAYDVKKGTLVNCTSFCFDMGDEMFFVIPTNDVEVGDIILVQGRPKCVVAVNDKTISVVNYEAGTVEAILPERHVFMGNTYFYGKIVSMFGNMFAAGDDDEGNGFQNILKFKMMSSIFGGGKGGGMFNGNGGLGQMMAMSMMMGNGGFGNMFGNMFNGMFGKKKKAVKTTEAKAADIPAVIPTVDEDDKEEDGE